MSHTLESTESMPRHGAETSLEPAHVSVRVKVAALWTSMLIVFAYVDIFSLYRPDHRADLAAGRLGDFTIGQPFLLATTVYVVIPAVMVPCALILRPRVNRIVNIALSTVYAFTIVAGTIGEWSYYVLASVVEMALLATIVHYAWTWPSSTGARKDVRSPASAGDRRPPEPCVFAGAGTSASRAR